MEFPSSGNAAAWTRWSWCGTQYSVDIALCCQEEDLWPELEDQLNNRWLMIMKKQFGVTNFGNFNLHKTCGDEVQLIKILALSYQFQSVFHSTDSRYSHLPCPQDVFCRQHSVAFSASSTSSIASSFALLMPSSSQAKTHSIQERVWIWERE